MTSSVKRLVDAAKQLKAEVDRSVHMSYCDTIIIKAATAAVEAEGDGWIEIKEGCKMPPLDAENCCMDEEDYGRFSDPVLVFDEDMATVLRAIYDGKKAEWSDATDADILHGVTRWQPLP